MDNYQPEILHGQKGEALLSRVNRLSDKLLHHNNSYSKEELFEYQKAADEINRLYRSKSHRYFLTKIGHFPSRILIQQISGYLRNRIKEVYKRGQ